MPYPGGFNHRPFDGVIYAAGATSLRRLSEHLGDVLNAKDRGVKGDGSTDDTAALNALLASMKPGGIIYLPAGTYSLGAGASGLVLNGMAALVGAGRDRTILRYTGSGAALKINDGSDATREHHGWILADLTLDGDDTGAYGLELGQTSVSPKSAGGLVERVRITGFATAGVNCVAAQLTNFLDAWIDHNQDGVHILGATNENDFLTFAMCRIRSNTARGVYATQIDSLTFDGCSLELNGEEALLVDKPDDVTTLTRSITVRNCWIEGNNSTRDPSTHPAQLRFVAAGFQQIENVIVDACRFSGRGVDNGERHIYVTRGNYEFRDNWFGFPQTRCLEAVDSVLVTIHGRSSRYQYGPNKYLLFVPAPRFPNIYWDHDGPQDDVDAYPYPRRWYVNSAVPGTALVPVLEMVGGDGNEAEGSRAPKLGFYGVAPVKRPDVTGSTGGNAALQNLLAQLEALGLLTDSTT